MYVLSSYKRLLFALTISAFTVLIFSLLQEKTSITIVEQSIEGLNYTDVLHHENVEAKLMRPPTNIGVTMYAGTTNTTCLDTTTLPGNLSAVTNINCSTLTNGGISNINTTNACVDFAAQNVAGMDTVCIEICDNLGNCDTTIIAYNIIPQPDTTVTSLAAGSGVTNSCPINLQYPGTLNAVTDLNCDVVNVGTINVNNTNGCVSYTPPSAQLNSGVRSDTVCVELCDNNGICDTMIYIFNNQEPNCSNLLPNGLINQQLTDCSDLYACIPNLPLDSIINGQYSLFVDAVPYTNDTIGCDPVSQVQYPFSIIPPCSGNYEVTWTANGIIYGPDTVAGVGGILSFMNFNDGNSAWVFNNDSSFAIGTNTSGALNYDVLEVTCIPTGTTTLVNDSLQTLYFQGTQLSFTTQGTYLISVEDQQGCRDSVDVTIFCSNTEQYEDTILVGGSGTFCLDTTQVPAVDTIINFCASASTGAAVFSIDQQTACVTYSGNNLGSDLACFLVCSASGACDTTYMYIDVAVNAPIAVDDSLSLPFGPSTQTINVCTNDIFDQATSAVQIITFPTKGTAVQNGCDVTYETIAGLCGEDFFQYIVYNSGGIDTATVILDIECLPFTIYEGFSPNGDGINDFMVIENISDFPGNEVVVYNRWGNLVFKQRDYQDNWGGTFQGRDLPDGNYYLIVYGAEGEVLGRTWLRILR